MIKPNCSCAEDKKRGFVAVNPIAHLHIDKIGGNADIAQKAFAAAQKRKLLERHGFLQRPDGFYEKVIFNALFIMRMEKFC